jgi:hypothetical protein
MEIPEEADLISVFESIPERKDETKSFFMILHLIFENRK